MKLESEIFISDTISEEESLATIKQQIKDNQLMIYMKGNAQLPQCGFSAQVIEILNQIGAKYKTFNVINHYIIRETIKKFSSWPTIPQVYYKEKFIGGCDIMIEMYQNGELNKLLNQ